MPRVVTRDVKKSYTYQALQNVLIDFTGISSQVRIACRYVPCMGQAHPHSSNLVPPIGRGHQHVKLGNRFHLGRYRGISV